MLAKNYKYSPMYFSLALAFHVASASAAVVVLNDTQVTMGTIKGGGLAEDSYILNDSGTRPTPSAIWAESFTTDYSKEMPLEEWHWKELSNTVVNGGTFFLSAVAKDTQINGGQMMVTGQAVSGGRDLTHFQEGKLALATNTNVTGGKVGVFEKGTVVNTTVSGTGKVNVYYGGNAHNTTVSDDGVLSVFEAGRAQDTIVGDKGKFQVYNTKEVTNTTIKSGGLQTVYAGSTNKGTQVTNTTIELGGQQNVIGLNTISQGNVIQGLQIVVNDAQAIDSDVTGKQHAYNRASLINSNIHDGGYSLAYGGAKVINANVGVDGTLYLETTQDSAGNFSAYGGHGENIVVNGGIVQVYGPHSSADNTKVNSGLIFALNGGSINNTEASGINSRVEIRAGATSTGTLVLKDGANLDMEAANSGQGAYAQSVYLADQSKLYIYHGASTTVDQLGGVSVDYLTVNDAQVLFGHPNDTHNPNSTYYVLSVGNLDGNATFNMRTHVEGTGFGADNIGDMLEVTGVSSGNHVLNVDDRSTGSAGVDGSERLKVVSTTDGGAQFALANKVDIGAYTYDLEKSSGTRATGEQWYLSLAKPALDPVAPHTKPDLNKVAQSSVNVLNTSYLLNYVETQTLLQRMGELRLNQDTRGDVWARAYTGQLDSFGDNRLSGFDMDYYGVQAGADKRLDLGNDEFYLGGMFGLGEGKTDQDMSHGKTKSYHVGVYGSYKTSNGFYVDGLVKYVHMKNTFDSRTSGGHAISGKGNTSGYSMSIEGGKRFYVNEPNNGLYIEPQLQLTYSHQDGTTVNAKNGLSTKLDSYDSTIGRASAIIGYQLAKNANPINVYFKTGYVGEMSGKTHFTFNGVSKTRESYDFGGSWWDNSIGVNAQIKKNHNVYLDANYSTGSKFNQKQINVGYRFSF